MEQTLAGRTALVTGSTSGTVSLTGQNRIATLGGFSTGGNAFTLTDAVALTQTGALSASTVTLSTTGASGMTLNGAINATSALVLNIASGGVQEQSGTIVTPNLSTGTGLTGDVILTGTANLIA